MSVGLPTYNVYWGLTEYDDRYLNISSCCWCQISVYICSRYQSVPGSSSSPLEGISPDTENTSTLHNESQYPLSNWATNTQPATTQHGSECFLSWQREKRCEDQEVVKVVEVLEISVIIIFVHPDPTHHRFCLTRENKSIFCLFMLRITIILWSGGGYCRLYDKFVHSDV